MVKPTLEIVFSDLLWNRVFHMCPHSNSKTYFLFMKFFILFIKKLDLPLILIYFKKKDKIKKKTLYDFLFGEDISTKTKFTFRVKLPIEKI